MDRGETRVLHAIHINKASKSKNIAFQQLKAAAYKKKLEGTQNYAKFCETRVKRLEAQRGALTTPAVKKAIEQYQMEEDKKENSPLAAAPSPSKVNMPAGSPTAFRRAKSMFERRDSGSIFNPNRNFSPAKSARLVVKEVSDAEMQTTKGSEDSVTFPEGTDFSGSVLLLKDGKNMEFDSESNGFKVVEVKVEVEVEVEVEGEVEEEVDEELIIEEEFGEPEKQKGLSTTTILISSLLLLSTIGGFSFIRRR
ncbi:hypothetical protein TrLO_g4742 [Triparma laevis f. longispina]|uniref:Uncharacterized protein n=1 Tax=Triparma laevis f. longispina TaxID=1714387 RepID=A0A9W7KRD1_9STRA|nr:hypothetical protein TrLO_g4742 [Triparma laevis f. longispina]